MTNNFKTHSDIYGNSSTNCIPLDKWMDSDSRSIRVNFYADVFDTSDDFEIKTKCVEKSENGHLNWRNRASLFPMEHSCYECHLK